MNKVVLKSRGQGQPRQERNDRWIKGTLHRGEAPVSLDCMIWIKMPHNRPPWKTRLNRLGSKMLLQILKIENVESNF